jgi:hypothetical protein
MDEMLFPDEAVAFLRETRYDPDARRGFEALTCALHWSDERLPRVARMCMNHGSRAYFYLMVFRSSLIQGKPKEEYRRTWDQLEAACPDWPGFRPERSSTELAEHLECRMNRIFRSCAGPPEDAEPEREPAQ